MQTDGYNYWGDVVLDSFNMAYRDEDSIWDKKCAKQIFWNLYYEDFRIKIEMKKMHI